MAARSNGSGYLGNAIDRRTLPDDQNILESYANTRIKYFEIIYGQIRGYACLALITK